MKVSLDLQWLNVAELHTTQTLSLFFGSHLAGTSLGAKLRYNLVTEAANCQK